MSTPLRMYVQALNLGHLCALYVTYNRSVCWGHDVCLSVNVNVNSEPSFLKQRQRLGQGVHRNLAFSGALEGGAWDGGLPGGAQAMRVTSADRVSPRRSASSPSSPTPKVVLGQHPGEVSCDTLSLSHERCAKIYIKGEVVYSLTSPLSLPYHPYLPNSLSSAARVKFRVICLKSSLGCSNTTHSGWADAL